MNNINYILVLILSIIFGNYAEAQTDFTAEKLIRKGNSEFVDSNFTAAEEQYQLAVLQDKDNFKAKYNLANTLFKQERFEEAAEAFEEILDNTPDDNIKANVYHNMANSKLANQDLEGSIEDYKNALRLNPKMQDTRYNLSYAMKLKDQQDQQEQQENKDNKDQDNKDDKNKDQDNKDKKDDNNKDQDKKEKDKDDQDKKDADSENKKDDKDKQDEDKEKPGEDKKQQVDKKETERLLRAVAEKEKETKEKLEKKKARVKAVKTEKDW